MYVRMVFGKLGWCVGNNPPFVNRDAVLLNSN
jgi:hypothetical protein